MKWLALILLAQSCSAEIFYSSALLKGVTEVLITVEGNPSPKGFEAQSIKDHLELAAQREGLRIASKGTDSPYGARLVLDVNFVCLNEEFEAACSLLFEGSIALIVYKPGISEKTGKESQNTPTIVVLAWIQQSIILRGANVQNAKTWRESTDGLMISFLNAWRKANPKP
jgi:hypothetical protein